MRKVANEAFAEKLVVQNVCYPHIRENKLSFGKQKET